MTKAATVRPQVCCSLVRLAVCLNSTKANKVAVAVKYVKYVKHSSHAVVE